MAALTTVVVAAAATAVAGAVAGAGAATGSGVGAAQVPQQVNPGGPEAAGGGRRPEGEVGAGCRTGSRPSPNRCPLQRGSGGGRRGVSLPLLAAWPTPGAVLCWLVLSAAFAKPPPCGFGIEGRSGWKPWLCRFLASRCEHTLSATQCLLQKLGLVTAPYRAVVLTSGKALAQSVVGDTFGARQWVAALLLPLRWRTQGGINTGWSEADVFPKICLDPFLWHRGPQDPQEWPDPVV